MSTDTGTAEFSGGNNCSSLQYACATCGAEDCKLWRPASVFAEKIELICRECLVIGKGHTIDLTRGDQVYDPEIEGTNWVPAVPNLTGDFWGYTSVPVWWCAWWKALPDHVTDCKYCGGTAKIEDMQCPMCRGTGNRSIAESRGQ